MYPLQDYPLQKVNLDQMQSDQPGLVPIMDGRHIKDRITSVTVFLDDHSSHSYSHLQISTGGDETLAAKHAYEIMAQSYWVAVQSYHGGNAFLAEKMFRYEVLISSQTINFCGVGAHHQHGYVENHIGRLTRGSRTLLPAAQRRWPEAIGEILWPFAWKDYEQCYKIVDCPCPCLAHLQVVDLLAHLEPMCSVTLCECGSCVRPAHFHEVQCRLGENSAKVDTETYYCREELSTVQC